MRRRKSARWAAVRGGSGFAWRTTLYNNVFSFTQDGSDFGE